MKHGSLFSGIGGFDLAAEWMGWENVFHCEINPFGQKVLHHYWPNATQYSDITKTDFSIHANTIDILTGGFPCQPYSVAGKRKGKEDERHLWPEMLRAIREIQPRWIVGENVFGLVNWSGGLVFDEVQADLETAGYEVQPYVLPAASKNAPHKRERIWFVAYSRGAECKGRQEFKKGQQYDGRGNAWSEFTPFGGLRNVTNSENIRHTSREGTNTGEPKQFHSCKQEENKKNGSKPFRCSDVTDTELRGCKERRWKSISGKRYNDFQSGGFQTQPLLRRGDDGLSNWVDRIKSLGNAIVPQVVFEIFKAIEHYEQMMIRDKNVQGSDTTGDP
jgi:DNA (cytosine-5)-methyltransferase 1